MSNHINEYCIPNKGENDFNTPLFLNDTSYEQYSNNKNNDDIGPLVTWKLENYNHNKKCLENNRHEKITLEDKISNNEQCVCINAWKKLEQIFELNDEDLKKMHTLKDVFPGDNFCNLPIDLNDDNCGESLKNFQLDGEHVQLGDLNSDDLYEEIKTSVKENEPLIDESKAQPDNKVNSDLKNDENNKTKNEDSKPNDTINKNEKKTDQTIIESTKSKTKKQSLKLSKKINKRCTGMKPSDKLNCEKANNGYNIEYVYTYGEIYRGGINCGHKKCVDYMITIPKNKGWTTDSFLSQVNIIQLQFNS